MGVMGDFKKFALKGNVIDLAVAVVIGAAFGKIITAIVESMIMPLVGAALPSGDWRAWTVWKIKIGSMLGATIDFIVIAFILFLIVRVVQRFQPPPPEVAKRDCPFCLESIPAAATRCRACTATVSAP